MVEILTPMSLALDGLSLSGSHEFGARIIAELVDGLGGPGTNLSPVNLIGARGSVAGEAQSTSRAVAIEGNCEADSIDAALHARDLIVSAAGLSERLLEVTQDATTRTMRVRRGGETRVTWETPQSFTFSILLSVLDPRMFGTMLTGSTGIPASSGGLAYPITYPITYSAVTTSGRVTLTSPGNVDGPVTMRITALPGGVTGPTVTHAASGKQLVFASSMSLAAGNWVDIDMERHWVKENGTALRNGWVISRGWSSFQPGGNEWSLAVVSGDALLEVFATPAWE